MTADSLPTPLVIAAVAFGVLGLILLLSGVAALFRARPLQAGSRTLLGMVFLAVGSAAALALIGIQCYRALTREALVAHIQVTPTSRQHFTAVVHYPDSRQTRYQLAGDEIYIDARVLKWKPVANLLGLHTAYELDRIAGRYRDIEQERSAERTVYSLGAQRPIDLFDLRQRYAWLEPLFDAEYGSATFILVTQPTEFELRISTTGLLIRQVTPDGTPGRS